MPDFSKSRAGDKVYSLRYGEGTITAITNRLYRIEVQFDRESGTFSYTNEGRSNEHYVTPDLYHAKPEISDPPPPKRMVKRTVWQNFCTGRVTGQLYSYGNAYSTQEEALACTSSNVPTMVNYIGTFPTEIEYEEEE